MTIPRMVGLLLAMTAVGLGVVLIRVDEAAISQRVQELQFRQTELRRNQWSQEMELARLRSPNMIRDRAERIGLSTSLAEPEQDKTRKGASPAPGARRNAVSGTSARRDTPAPVRAARGERD
jgi:hypothetical protein